MAEESDLKDAREAARRAAEGRPTDDFIERLIERIGGHASVRAVFADPVERDGLTIIPVARVRWGVGGGTGQGPGTAADSGSGSGGGGGLTADPVGYIEIRPDGAAFVPIADPRPSPGFLLAAGVAGAMVLRAIARLTDRR